MNGLLKGGPAALVLGAVLVYAPGGGSAQQSAHAQKMAHVPSFEASQAEGDLSGPSIVRIDDQCFFVVATVVDGDFFSHLKRAASGDGAKFSKGGQPVYFFPDRISIQLVADPTICGGELPPVFVPAALVVDAVTRLLPGALGNEASSIYESFSRIELVEIAADPVPRRAASLVAPEAAAEHVSAAGAEAAAVLLDCPHYTRPAEFRGWPVPEVLLGGNHEEIRRWRRAQAIAKTRRNRPDLLGR